MKWKPFNMVIIGVYDPTPESVEEEIDNWYSTLENAKIPEKVTRNDYYHKVLSVEVGRGT